MGLFSPSAEVQDELRGVPMEYVRRLPNERLILLALSIIVDRVSYDKPLAAELDARAKGVKPEP